VRLLIAVHSAERGGAELSSLAAAQHLAPRHELVIAIPRGPLRRQFAELGSLVEGPRLLPLWGADASTWLRASVRTGIDSVRLARLARREEVDAIVVSSAVALSPLLAGRLARVPVLVHLRDFPHSWVTRFVYAIDASLAHTVVPVSAFAERVLPERTRARVVRIPDGVTPLAEPPPFPHEDWPLRVVVIGPLEPHKGQDVAVRAMAELHRRGVEAELELVGREQVPLFARRLRSQAADLGLADRVHFTGPVADVGAVLAQSHVVVAPSRGETLGLTALEAANHARPVVASRVGGLPEVVEDGRTGLLVRAGDAHAFSDALATLASDRGRARILGIEGRRRIAARYDRYSCLDDIEKEILRLGVRTPPKGSQKLISGALEDPGPAARSVS
jgi:glycosyltransferase involved in cell wall biosynthesis